MAIEFKDFTGGEHEGRGAFDELMRTAKSHLVTEFNEQRITSAEYSQMYLNVMTAAMSTALQYTMQSGIASRQEELLQEQTNNAIQQTLISAQQLLNLKKEEILIDAKILQDAQNLLNSQAELVLVNAKVAESNATVLISTKQLAVMDAQLLGSAADTAMKTQQRLNAITQEIVIGHQGTKILGEITLLNQKRLTEQAQILDTVDGNPVTGVIGRQKTLYLAQENGFARDAEQKVLKFMTDNWGLRLNSDGSTVLPSGFTNAEIDRVLNKAKAGIGL